MPRLVLTNVTATELAMQPCMKNENKIVSGQRPLLHAYKKHLEILTKLMLTFFLTPAAWIL